MKISSVAGLLVAVSVAGCSVQVKMNEKNETDLGSHHVVVKPGSTFTSSSSSSGGDSETYQYKCGEVSIEIRNEELIVNNIRYGQLASGAGILVDHGTVFVGGDKREGTAMTPKEMIQVAPVKETTKELDGYSVTVRPGSSFTSTTQVFGKHTLTVGKTAVAIKNGEFFVNGTPFGKLGQGDTILVAQGAVSVSGEAR